MIVYPNAKINIGLRIVARRTDGFHDIETCFFPVFLCDILEINETNSTTTFSTSGISIPGKDEENICVQAWHLLKRKFDIPPVNIHLHKLIPIGAGLGGGSADGAFMLKGLNDLFNLKLSEQSLLKSAAELGSDCAFFISNQPAIGKERGNILEPLNLSLADFKIILINPGIHIGTAEAYAAIKPMRPESELKELLSKPVSEWKDKVLNDFEAGVFQKYPEIQEVKRKLYELGASFAAMSGSGSTVFGLFYNAIPDEVNNVFGNYFLYNT